MHGIILLNVQWGLKGFEELINIHPLFVHFPIALLLASSAFYFLGALFRKESLLEAGKWTLYTGAVGAVLTAWTGYEASQTVSHGGGMHQMMMTHQYLGFAVLGISLVLSAWVFFSKANIPVKGKPAFLLALVVLAAVLIQGADFGGRMVFLNGVGVGKKSMIKEMIADSHTQHEHGEHEHHGY